jgi:hypothetical protein
LPRVLESEFGNATLRHWTRGRKMTYLNMALSAFTPRTIVPTLSLKTDRGARKGRLPASLSNSTMLTLSVDDCPFGSGEASALPTTRELWASRKRIGIGTRLETHARGKRADSVVRLTESEGATLKRGTIVTAAGPISIVGRWHESLHVCSSIQCSRCGAQEMPLVPQAGSTKVAVTVGD